ncbi:hypothetical protein SRHO_G00080730 [Serrasalmus rhombeus]
MIRRREVGGSPDLRDDECSEIFLGLIRRAPSLLVTEATCLQSDSEVSDGEKYKGLEDPACPDGTTDSTPTRAKEWKKLRTRISSFLRRVFCFGCLPSQCVVPL